MKPIIRQLAIGTFVLVLVTVASLGIRHVRFSLHQANTVEGRVVVQAERAPSPSGFETVEAKPEPEYDRGSEPIEETASDDQLESQGHSDEDRKDLFTTDSSEGDDTRSKGSKGLEKISLSDNENLYLTAEGELWYVSKGPNGNITKMQVEIDDLTGEITVVKDGGSAKSDGSPGLERISLGEHDDLYLTEKGEQWYVSEWPDGSVTKSQVEIDDLTGEITSIDSGHGGK